MNIQAKLHHYKFTKEKLLADYPALANDQEALLDTLEGETDLDAAIVSILRSAEEDGMFAETLKDMEADYAARRKLLLSRRDAKRLLAANTIVAAEMPTIRDPFATISAKARPDKLVVDCALLPPDYLKVIEHIPAHDVMAPDLELIARAIADKHEVPGAKYEAQDPVVTVRKK